MGSNSKGGKRTFGVPLFKALDIMATSGGTAELILSKETKQELEARGFLLTWIDNTQKKGTSKYRCSYPS